MVLAFAFGEVAAEDLGVVLEGALLSAVNAAEFVSKYLTRGLGEGDARGLLAHLAVRIADFDTRQAMSCGLLHRQTRASGLSLGDCACLALAQRQGLPAYTADRMWVKLDVGVEVRLIR